MTQTPRPATADTMLTRIRKLLAMAEDRAATPAEAESFTLKAAELIAKYGIDAARLAEADPTSDRPADRKIRFDAPYAREKATLLYAVAIELRCKAVLLRESGDLVMHLFGFDADLDRAELLYTSLLVQASHALAAEKTPRWEHPAAFRRTWLMGYARAIQDRLRAAERRAQANEDAERTGGRSMDLVLRDRSAVVTAAAAAAYPQTRKQSRRLSGSGYAGGYGAGQRADLGGTRLSGRTAGGQIGR